MAQQQRLKDSAGAPEALEIPNKKWAMDTLRVQSHRVWVTLNPINPKPLNPCTLSQLGEFQARPQADPSKGLALAGLGGSQGNQAATRLMGWGFGLGFLGFRMGLGLLGKRSIAMLKASVS